MFVKTPEEFINQIKAFKIATEFVVVKPNWVSIQKGEYTEPEILDWLFEALPKQKKIVIESYTPWRGLKFESSDKKKEIDTSLLGGKKCWDFYKKQDLFFLKATGLGKILNKYKAEYINVTNDVWAENCVDKEIIKKIIEKKGESIQWEEFYSYIPKRIYDIRKSATLISMSKIKTEESIQTIFISMSTKNLFGLIPHPYRWTPFHKRNHTLIPKVIKDIYIVYTCLFDKTLWITEGVKALVRHYCDSEQKIVKNQNLIFVGTNAKKVDSKACTQMGIDPKKVSHLQMIS